MGKEKGKLWAPNDHIYIYMYMIYIFMFTCVCMYTVKSIFVDTCTVCIYKVKNSFRKLRLYICIKHIYKDETFQNSLIYATENCNRCVYVRRYACTLYIVRNCKNMDIDNPHLQALKWLKWDLYSPSFFMDFYGF